MAQLATTDGARLRGFATYHDHDEDVAIKGKQRHAIGRQADDDQRKDKLHYADGDEARGISGNVLPPRGPLVGVLGVKHGAKRGWYVTRLRREAKERTEGEVSTRAGNRSTQRETEGSRARREGQRAN